MIYINKLNIFKILLIMLIAMIFMNDTKANYNKLIFDFKISTLKKKSIKLSEFNAKAFLIVNVASKCGFTKQYNGLQELWEKYKNDGLVVIGFPSNQFGSQEPGTNNDIKDFCESNFNINFPIVLKTDVKGRKAHEIYKWALKNHGKSSVPKWNFHKILINKEGKIEDTFLSFTTPMSNKITSKIERILN